jgi:hypothetical protein
MKATLFLLASLCVPVSVARTDELNASSGEYSTFVNKTFQQIQKRAEKRDAETGAILTVAPSEDAPTPRGSLVFNIAETPDAGVYVVTISQPLKSAHGIYEQYRLRADQALRQELQKQKRHRELEQQRLTQKQKQNIAALSDDKLQHGMTEEQVIALWGKPQNIEHKQSVGAFIAIYAKARLHFQQDRLCDMETSEAASAQDSSVAETTSQPAAPTP